MNDVVSMPLSYSEVSEIYSESVELWISNDVLVVVGCGGSDATVVSAICELVAVGLSGDGKGGEAGSRGT